MCLKRAAFVPSPLSCFRRAFSDHERAEKQACCRSTTSVSMVRICGVSEVYSGYDAVLLDQFGVIHDGRTAYPRALEAIKKLKNAGLKVVILSNSSRPAHHALKKLEKMGIDVDCIHGVVTSGQIALDRMKSIMPNTPDARVLHFNWTAARGGGISLREHDIHEIVPLNDARKECKSPFSREVDFVLAHGTDGITSSHDMVQEAPLHVLRNLCRELGRSRPGLPFYCANPDMVTVDGPTLRIMPGTLAQDFEDAGGQNVMRLGKPDIVAYDAATALLDGVDKSRILAIGDSLAHDILGAANAGIDSLYIAGGINAEHFRIRPADGFEDAECSWYWDSDQFENLLRHEAPPLKARRPTYICPFFRW